MDEQGALKFLRGGLCGTARRLLNLKTRDMEPIVGRTFAAIGNFEEARFRMAPEVERRYIDFLLGEFARRGGAPVPDQGITLEEARIELAKAVIAYRTARAIASAAGTGGGTADLFRGIVESAIYDQKLQARFKNRMIGLLEEYKAFEATKNINSVRENGST